MNKTSLTIGVFTPYFQGDYIGEILNHLRRLCEHKGFHLRAIQTNSFGTFQVGLGIYDIEGAIIIRNAIHPKLVEKLQHQNIPVIAIAHDYFPLDVPVIASDNSGGIDLAFDHLISLGHNRLTFIGDVSHYDIRKRYERFSDRLKAHDPLHDYDPLICTPDALFSGGLAGANEYLRRNNNCSGVICGAGHTAIGFIKRLEESKSVFNETGQACMKNLEIVAFDHLPLMDILTPDLAHIDQNLDLLAMRAIDSIEHMIQGANFLNETIFIPPTLYTGNRPKDRKSHRLPSPTKNDYILSINSNCQEMIRNVVAKDLDDIMVFSPLFDQFMAFGCLTKLIIDNDHRQQLQVIKTFDRDETTVPNNNLATYRTPPEKLSPTSFKLHVARVNSNAFHFPIHLEYDLWGVLSFFGNNNPQSNSDFLSFANCMESIAHLFGLHLQIKLLNDEVDPTPPPPLSKVPVTETPSPTLEWDLERGHVQWNDLALDLLGFTTDLERNIYRTMDIFDRIHDEDLRRIRKEITLSLTNHQPMTTVAKLKNAEGHFQKFSFQGEITHYDDNQATRYKCILSQIN